MKKKEIKLIKEKNFFQVLRDKKSVKDFEEEGVSGIEIEWYASTKDKDRGHDIVDPQAFKSALDLYMTNPIVLLQHNMEKPIGVITEAKIDDNGLYVKARITQDVDWVISAIKNGVLRAFSIGYKILDSEFLEEQTADGRDYANIIKDLKLFEVSVVSVPMNPYSLMKSMQDCFELKEVAEEEKEVVAENAKTAEDQEEKSADEDVEAESDKDKEEKKSDSDDESDEDEEQDPPTDTDESDEEEEDKKSLAPEGKKADENSDIEEPEKSAQPENGAETAPESKKALGTAEGLKDLQIKSVENFISAEMKSIEKKFLDQLAEKDEKIWKLEEKLKKALELLGGTIEVLWQLDKAVANTVIKTWYTYQAPKQKQNSSKYSSLVAKLQDS